MATRRDVTDSPAEQGLEVGPSGSGSPLNVRTRKHPAREVSTSGCGPVRLPTRSPRNGPVAVPFFGLGKRLPTLRGWTRRPSGRRREGLPSLPHRFRWEVEQGFGPQPPSVTPFGTSTGAELEHDDVGVSLVRQTRSELHRWDFSGTCMRPFNGLSPLWTSSEGRVRETSDAPSLFERVGHRAAVARSLNAGRTRVDNGRKATAAVTRYGCG